MPEPLVSSLYYMESKLQELGEDQKSMQKLELNGNR